jgi:SAM-dependent methyltransferase
MGNNGNGNSLYQLDERNRERLVASAPLAWEWSRSSCAHKKQGGMEEWANSQTADAGQTCDWYHGVWQFLRLLNMVAVPAWYEFYERALGDVLRAKPRANVLISAAADYGMLCTLHESIVDSGSAPTITICDICQTPLTSSQWYADRHQLDIACICDDLLSTPKLADESFDLIVTDELLTVLKGGDKPLIVDRWRRLLKPDGFVVTTAMIGAPTTPELREGYAERARRLFDVSRGLFDASEADAEEMIDRFERFARFHTRHMLTGEAELRSLFSGFDFSFTRTVTPGECVNPTESFQVVASLASSDDGADSG